MNWTDLKYQIKVIGRDKMCVLTFLLPILAGLALNLLSGLRLSSISEPAFAILQNNLAAETISWLGEYGSVTAYDSMDDLADAVREPSTQAIGILSDGTGIQVLRSGDEWTRTAVTADLLPRLYADRSLTVQYKKTTLPSQADDEMMKHLLIVITMVTAMFMGCTFNAMNIIGEKEDGIIFINQILPMTKARYVGQKIAVGLAGGILSTTITALICMRPAAPQILPLLLLILLSAFIAALMGLFIGKFSENLMVGIVYIKIIMILFLAPPILFYLLLPADGIVHILSYLLPSSATFYGLMKLLGGNAELTKELLVLAGHCAGWFIIFFLFPAKSPIMKTNNVRNVRR